MTEPSQTSTATSWPEELFDYTLISPDLVTEIGDAALAEANALVAAAVSAAEDDGAVFADVIGRLDLASGDLSVATGRSGFMVRVHPDEAVRTAAQRVDDRIMTWGRSLPLRDDVAAAVARYAATPDAAALEGEERLLLDRWQLDLGRAGHNLPEEARVEVRTITARLVALEAEFQRNVDDWEDGIEVKRDELDGLPESYIAALRPGKAPRTLRVSLDYPEYYPFMEGSSRRDLRAVLLAKRFSRAVEANRPMLEDILALRRRQAAILGYPSWAHYRIEPKMARTPERVDEFHAGLLPPIQALAAGEYTVMSGLLEADTGDRVVRLWDAPYYDQRIRAKDHGVDPEEVSAYLGLETAFDGLLALTAEVFGLRYAEVADPRAWHPDVRLFEVLDASSGVRLGWFYTDLHPRPGKYGHAMAYPIRYGRRGRDGRREGGVSAIVANVPRSTPTEPARLRHDDMEMLFHEFGHVLHEVLGTNTYFRTSMDRLESDFPEAVSQIMENWAWQPSILVRVSRHPETGMPMPVALAERIAASRTVNLGSRFLGSFGSPGVLDMLVHGPAPVDLDEAAREADAVRLLPSAEGTYWPASFDHIVGGYDAGYYGYLWSLVYGYDLWSRFEAEGIINPDVGAAFRRDIFEAGSSRAAEDLVEAFLGRPSNNEAFLRLTGIGRRVEVPAGD
jgi:thimet oligopeptidase